MGTLLRNHEVRFVPVSQPVERRGFYATCRFKATYSATCALLDRELSHLDAKHIVIQLHCDDSQIRNDGMPRSDARMLSPMVILSFESKYGPLSYPCSRFQNWQDNLRAIALSLEALRTVDRYGVTRRAEQYRGWKAITYRGDDHFQNAEQAAKYLAALDPVRELGVTMPQIMSSADVEQRAYKAAATRYHPDAGGEAGAFSKVTAAHEILRGYHERRQSPGLKLIG